MKISPLKTVNCWKTPVGWCGFVTQDGSSEEGGGSSLSVVYGKTLEECEARFKVVHAALEKDAAASE